MGITEIRFHSNVFSSKYTVVEPFYFRTVSDAFSVGGNTLDSFSKKCPFAQMYQILNCFSKLTIAKN